MLDCLYKEGESCYKRDEDPSEQDEIKRRTSLHVVRVVKGKVSGVNSIQCHAHVRYQAHQHGQVEYVAVGW